MLQGYIIVSEFKITTKDVLKVIAVGGLVITFAAVPGLAVGLAAIVKDWEKAKAADLGRIIKRLEKQKMISIQEMNSKTSITITEKGKRRLLEYDFENIELKKKKRDGKWRMILFDIPENKRRNRNAFIRKLREIDCIRLQDSVYVSAYPCINEVNFLCHYLEISDFVTVLTVHSFERGEQLFFKQYIEY